MTPGEMEFEVGLIGVPGGVSVETAAELAAGSFVDVVMGELCTQEETMAPMASLLEFAERLIESADGASCLDVLVMMGEIFEGWSLDCREREAVVTHFGRENLREAIDRFCGLHGSTLDQVYVEWYYRVRIERGERSSYVFVGSDGGAMEYPGEFVSALNEGGEGLGTLAHIDGVVVFGDNMSGIYG